MKKVISVIAWGAVWILLLASLALNVYAIRGLLQVQQVLLAAQQAALTTVGDARAALAGIGDDTISYTFSVQQDIPVRATVPFNEQFTVPIRATLPISTVVIIPINAGLLGTYSVDVPIRTVVPVNFDVTVPISKTIHVSTTVPLDLDVPISIPLAETPLAGYLEGLDDTLGNLEASLGSLDEGLVNPPLGGGTE